MEQPLRNKKRLYRKRLVWSIIAMILIGCSAGCSSNDESTDTVENAEIDTSNTDVVLNSLTKDVTCYWIVSDGHEDESVKTLLDKYETMSDHIRIVTINPNEHPEFAAIYTDGSVENNSVVVECAERCRYISYNDFYVTIRDSHSYSTFFDGESVISSAIEYVSKDVLATLYTLDGHGESALPDTFADSVENANIDIKKLSIKESGIPENADLITIYAPTSDISGEERDMLSEYTKNGGKLMVISGPVEDGTLTTLNSLLEDYDITVQDGIVIEEELDYHASGYPYVLIPDMNADNKIMNSLVENNYYAVLPVAQGLNVSMNSNATKLLVTSDSAFSKAAGYSMSTYEKEDDDTDGPFTLAVSIQTDNDGGIIWFTCSNILDMDFTNTLGFVYDHSANDDLVMNSIESLIGTEKTSDLK